MCYSHLYINSITRLTCPPSNTYVLHELWYLVRCITIRPSQAQPTFMAGIPLGIDNSARPLRRSERTCLCWHQYHTFLSLWLWGLYIYYHPLCASNALGVFNLHFNLASSIVRLKLLACCSRTLKSPYSGCTKVTFHHFERTISVSLRRPTELSSPLHVYDG